MGPEPTLLRVDSVTAWVALLACPEGSRRFQSDRPPSCAWRSPPGRTQASANLRFPQLRPSSGTHRKSSRRARQDPQSSESDGSPSQRRIQCRKPQRTLTPALSVAFSSSPVHEHGPRFPRDRLPCLSLNAAGYAPCLRKRISPPLPRNLGSGPDSSQTHLVPDRTDVWSCHSASKWRLPKYPRTNLAHR